MVVSGAGMPIWRNAPCASSTLQRARWRRARVPVASGERRPRTPLGPGLSKRLLAAQFGNRAVGSAPVAGTKALVRLGEGAALYSQSFLIS